MYSNLVTNHFLHLLNSWPNPATKTNTHLYIFYQFKLIFSNKNRVKLINPTLINFCAPSRLCTYH